MYKTVSAANEMLTRGLTTGITDTHCYTDQLEEKMSVIHSTHDTTHYLQQSRLSVRPSVMCWYYTQTNEDGIV